LKIITLPKVSSITTLTNIDDLGLGIFQANGSGINISTISIFGRMVATNKYVLIPQELGCLALIKLGLKTIHT
jgi:hypothetical protein